MFQVTGAFAEFERSLLKERQREGIAARGLEFTILTAARTGEVIGARWPEIDFDSGGRRFRFHNKGRIQITAQQLIQRLLLALE